MMDERNKKFNKEKDTIPKSYYYKYVYSSIINKYLQRKINRINGVTYELLADYDSKNPAFKPVYVKCVEQAMNEAIIKLCGDLPQTFQKLEVVTYNIIISSKIDKEINKLSDEINDLKSKIDSIGKMSTTDKVKDAITIEANNELIHKEFELIDLKNKKLLDYNFDHKLANIKRLLKNVKESIINNQTIEYKGLFPKIIAIDRDEIIICIHLSNRNIDDIDLDESVTKGGIVEWEEFHFKQNRINLNIKWRICII